MDFATHRSRRDTLAAYDPFTDASAAGALKVVLEGAGHNHGSNGHVAASLGPGTPDPSPRCASAMSHVCAAPAAGR